WVARGAPWPGGGKATDGVTAEQRRWWAFQPVRPVRVPDGEGRSAIDRFLRPRASAERRVLLRRVAFDLTGLPPAPDDPFLSDERPDAWERLIDRLLSSPAQGQRWARHWLDVVRYADYHDGDPKARTASCEPLNAWRYRDWVVRAFNADLPYDRFVVHQIAGDRLPDPAGGESYEDGLVATTFLTNGAWDRGDADKEKMASDMVDDQIDTVGKAFLGLTLGCARCHDHKFDPVTTRDYYALAGIFYSTRILETLGTKGGEYTLQRIPLVPRAYLAKRAEQLKRKDKSVLPEPPVAEAAQDGGTPGGLFPRNGDVPLHVRGSYARLGAVVPRGFPRFFAGDKQPSIGKGSGRPELAAWIATEKNPLTARVIVNRVWAWHFGTGLVRTPNNFGMLSEPPSHPRLLDWLAARFVEDGWSLKALHRRLLLSDAYRQAGPPRRLEAEALRDAMLSVAGRLEMVPGGPATHDLGTRRRSLYVQTARWDRSSYAALFDAANPDASVEGRDESTVAPQALFLLNHAFVKEQAERLAERVRREAEDDTARVHRLFRLALARPATVAELGIMRRLLAKKAGWRDLAHVVLCSNEFAYLD
ncbi:MAG: DUF1549 and DUF1553 domain-containing protein, partial [Gemmataceae bacterium]|nr:DUF1549 and DUF1553 domain-containing protein [Gemmataceae bacterium]